MPHATSGDTVKVHYTGRLADGSVFDSSRDREPLEFTLGEGQLLPGFERAVEGLEPGEVATTEIAAADAYGERNEQQVFKVPRAQLPDGVQPQVGQRVRVEGDAGQSMVVTVTDTSDESITLDANHPLAGQDLSFEIELVEIAP